MAAKCDSTGNASGSCSNYDWYWDENGDGHRTGNACLAQQPSSECFDQWGYEYRNCTSYVAWKLSTLGVPAGKFSGLHNGGQWAANAPPGVLVDGTPAVGSAAVKVGSVGHVAFVEAVSGSQITVSEYNGHYDGTWGERSGTPGSLGFTKFVHFEASGLGGGSGTAEGSFVQVSGQGSIYRIVGGAPLYVSDWAVFGGQQPYTVLSQSAFDALRAHPVDGTFVNAVTSAGAEQGSYVIAGGAPLYISSWGVYGGEPVGVVRIDAWDIANVGSAPSHLRATPVDGTFVNAVTSAGAEQGSYVIAGGAPLYISSWGVYGGEPAAMVRIDAWDIANITDPASHLNARPADGTFVNAVTSSEAEYGSYVIAGGAPFAITTWSTYGGEPPGLVRIDSWDLTHLGSSGSSGLVASPASGTIVKGLPSGKSWQFSSSCRSTTASGGVGVPDTSLSSFATCQAATPSPSPTPTVSETSTPRPTPTVSGTQTPSGSPTAPPSGSPTESSTPTRETTYVAAHGGSVTHGHRITLHADGLPTNASGSVTFTTAAGRHMCSASVTNGRAGCKTPRHLKVGHYRVVVRYHGDANYKASTAHCTLWVTKA